MLARQSYCVGGLILAAAVILLTCLALGHQLKREATGGRSPGAGFASPATAASATAISNETGDRSLEAADSPQSVESDESAEVLAETMDPAALDPGTSGANRNTSLREIAERLRGGEDATECLRALETLAARQGLMDEARALAGEHDGYALMVAASALASVGTPEALDSLLGMFDRSASEEDRRAVTTALASITNVAPALQLLDALRLPDDDAVADAAQRSLAAIASDQEVLALIAGRFRLSNDPVERDRLLGVVRLTASADAVPLLSLLAQQGGADSSESLAHAAIDALGTIGSRAAVERLFTNMQQMPQSGRIIAESVRRVASSEARDLLLSVATGADSVYTSGVARVAAIAALGNYRDTAVAEKLYSLTAAGLDDETSRAAEQSLARVRQGLKLN